MNGYYMEFDENVTLDEIYREMVYYKNNHMKVYCKYRDQILTNENLEELKSLVERLKMNMTEKEYKVFVKQKDEQIKTEKFVERIVFQKATSLKLVKFWINTAKHSVPSDLTTYFEIYCYNYLSLALIDNNFIIIVSKIIIKLDECENEKEISKFIREILSTLPIDLDFDLLIKFLKKFSKKQYILKKVLYDYVEDEINETNFEEEKNKVLTYVKNNINLFTNN